MRVVDLEREPGERPESLVAVPSFVYDGRVIALGNPRQADLFASLRRLLGARSVREGGDGASEHR